jgi:hypothetical protein
LIAENMISKQGCFRYMFVYHAMSPATHNQWTSRIREKIASLSGL